MPPPRTNPLFLLQCPHKTSLPSSRVIHGNRRTLTRHHGRSTRPTRTQHHHATHPCLLHAQFKCFSTRTPIRKEQNYYEILDVPITATPADIKKSVYTTTPPTPPPSSSFSSPTKPSLNTLQKILRPLPAPPPRPQPHRPNRQRTLRKNLLRLLDPLEPAKTINLRSG